MKICPICKTEFPDDMKFCSKCGSELIARENLSFCQFCGAPMEAGSVFCSKCGRRPDGSMIVTSQPVLPTQPPIQQPAQQMQTYQATPTVPISARIGSWWAQVKTRLNATIADLKADKKKLHTLAGIIVAIVVA